MSENKERCPHCTAEIDNCPCCGKPKPENYKLCLLCFPKWSAEMKDLQERFTKAQDHINERYNHKPKCPLVELGEAMGIPYPKEDEEND